MKPTIKWHKNAQGKLSSEDGWITVYRQGDQWVMDDQLEGEKEVFSNRNEALDESARRMMITKIGEFNVFLRVAEKNGDLTFDHQISKLFA